MTGRSLLAASTPATLRFLATGNSWPLRGAYEEGTIWQLRVAPVANGADPAARVLLDNDDVNWLAPYDWTPDFRSIAVVLQRQDRTGAIGLVSTRDGSFQQLRSVAWDAVSNMAISPDGTFLAFDRRSENRARDVFILAIDGNRVSRSGELFRVPLDGSGSATSVAATPSLDPFRVLGIAGNRIYLAKREKANEPLEVWSLAETGAAPPWPHDRRCS
jgi:hypothetical protein